VAADAAVWASRQRRREVYVGTSSVITILGNKLLPGPVDRGAHGSFDTRAHEKSPQLWATKHRGVLLLAGAGALAAAVALSGSWDT
jgi:hypothetical protein